MKTIPAGLSAYKKTPVFDENSIPQGLRNDHNTQTGVWGKIHVTAGKLIYTIQSNPQETIILQPGVFGIVEPEVLHNVCPEGKVQFYVEFHK